MMNLYRIRILGLVLVLLLTNTLTGLALSPNGLENHTVPLAGAGNVAAVPVAGNWSGLTNLGFPVSFSVNAAGTQWDTIKLTTEYVNGGCSVKLTTTINGQGTITNNHFSYTGTHFSLSGDFTSATTATGTYTYTNQSTGCGTFSQSGTWSASTQPTVSISGSVGVGGATLSFTDGTAQTVTSQPDGSYSLIVSSNWTGTVTPTHPCYTFTPTSKSYSNVTSNQTVQNYTPTFNSAPVCAVTVGVFRPTNGALYLKNSNTTGFADVQINYGVGGDYPVVGDWDGNGTATIGVYRSATGTFYLRNSNSSGNPDMIFSLGVAGDVGIAGDWNNDGFDTTGVFRPSNGALYLKNQNTTGIADIQINYGLPGDKPVTGDWDNNGTDTIGVYRSGTFYLRNSNTIGFADIVFALGVNGDMPIAGNWDGLP
jgi:hypothetical protein